MMIQVKKLSAGYCAVDYGTQSFIVRRADNRRWIVDNVGIGLAAVGEHATLREAKAAISAGAYESN